MIHYPIPVIGFSAYSGTGKTTLLTQVLPLLRNRGLRLGVIKHAHDQFEIDHPDKDSSKLRFAGADTLLICSKHRRALIEELEESSPEPTLDDALSRLAPNNLDLVLVEGFKHARFPKIELHRKELAHRPRFSRDHDIIAIISNDSAENLGIDRMKRAISHLPLDQPELIADFIVDFTSQANPLARTQNPPGQTQAHPPPGRFKQRQHRS